MREPIDSTASRSNLATRRGVLVGLGALGASVGTASIGRAQAKRASTPLAKASDFGAVGDGKTDGTMALRKALNSGQVIDGGGGRFKVAGNIQVEGNFKGLVNATLIQTTPDGDSRRTLMIDKSNDFVLENVEVQRGGSGAEHPDIKLIGKNTGVFIGNSRDFQLRGVKVSGGGIGSGIMVAHSTAFTADDLEAHDIWYDLPRHPDDDAIQGIFFADCRNFIVRDSYAHDIGGIAGGKRTNDNNRGFAFGSCSDFQLVRPRSIRVGQGVDVTGGGGNQRFTISNGLAEDCYSWGFKFANSANHGVIEDSTARRCGLAGFVANGQAETDGAVETSSITMIKCTAEDPTGNIPRVNETVWYEGCGFRIIGFKGPHKDSVPTYPRDVLFSQCIARSRSPVGHMMFGFNNDIPADRTDGKPNRVIDCKAEGWTKAPFKGFGA